MLKRCLVIASAALLLSLAPAAHAQQDTSPNALAIFSPYNTINNYTRTLSTRLTQLRSQQTQLVDGELPPWAAYTQNNFVYNKQDAQDRTYGYIDQNLMTMVGIDKFFTDNLAIGINTGYSYSALEFYDTKHPDGSVNAILLSSYAGYFTDTWYFTGTLSAAHSNIDLERSVNLGASTAIAKSDHVAKTVGTSAAIGYQFDFKNWKLAPEFAINYIRTNDDGYTESGPASRIYKYEKRLYEALTSDLSIRATSSFPINKWTIDPYLMFGWRHDFYDTEYLDAKSVSTGTEYTIITPEQGENALLVEIAMSATDNKSLTFTTGFRVELHEYYQAFGLISQFRYNF